MECRQVITGPLSVSSYASKSTGLRASVVGSSQARLQLGCSPVEEGTRSGKRRIAASATIKGMGVVLEGVHAWDSHIHQRPRSMHDEREGLLGLIGVVTRVLKWCL